MARVGNMCGPNDGGIKRGDREETGDNEARPSEDGDLDGSGEITGDPSALAARIPRARSSSAVPHLGLKVVEVGQMLQVPR